jgi:precorrin-3B synthase
MTATFAAFRRDACPTLLTPMATGDGFLVRLPPIGPLSLAAFAALCAAAEACGNGIVEVTQRGSIQIRGLTVSSSAVFAERLAALGIAGEGSPQILANPLAGLDAHEVCDAREIATELRAALVRAPLSLAPKVSVVVDGGGLHLDRLAADLRLRATSCDRLLVSVGGDGTTALPLGAVARSDAGTASARLLAVLAEQGDRARAKEIVERKGLANFRSALGDMLLAAGKPPSRPPAEPIGVHALNDGRVAIGIGLAFGQAHATTLRGLVDAVDATGGRALIAAELRSLLAIGIARNAVTDFTAAAERLGLVTRAGDPRRAVIACAGAPACASAEMPARGIAAEITRAAAPMLDGSVRIHLSGCAKGCAHPGPASLTVVGRGGRSGIVIGGTARDAPSAVVAVRALAAHVAALAERVAAARRAGEQSADALKRLGAEATAARVEA